MKKGKSVKYSVVSEDTIYNMLYPPNRYAQYLQRLIRAFTHVYG